MILWRAYLQDFTEKYDSLKGDLLEVGHVEVGPILAPKDRKFPASAPFGVDWAVIFADGKYFRVKEAYNRSGPPRIGSGIRGTFSFHYGMADLKRDPQGFPIFGKLGTPPADIRIDWHPPGPHIHLHGEDHIPQDRVQGYSIVDADFTSFVEAVAKHRRTYEPIQDLLGIKVIP